MPLDLEHRCSELRVLLGRFYLWCVCHILPYPFWLHLVENWFYLILACFLGHLLVKCFPIFHFEVVSVFVTEVCFLYAAKCWVLFTYPVSLCLFIGVLSPLILRDIKEKWLLLPAIFVVRSGVMFVWLSSFGFLEKLLSCFFLGCSLVFSIYYPLNGWKKILSKFGFVMEYLGFSIYSNWEFC